MAEVKVPILDNTGKVAAAFWPDEVADLGANVLAAVENEVAAEVPPLISTHNNDTTSVHGITDTSVLVTTTGTHAVSGTWTAGSGGKFAGVGAVTICTSGTRPGSPVEGQVIYETDTDAFYGWRGTMWLPIGGGATGGGTDDVFYENSQTVSTSYEITAGKNAGSFGPVTIAGGVTVTVPSGSVWTVV